MSIDDLNPLADSLVYVASLPLSWSLREKEYPENEYSRIAEHNEHVLRCTNLLGEQHLEKIDDETDSAMLRMEAKLNLLLELVSKLEQRIKQIPEALESRLASGGIEWKCSDLPPTVGSNIWINLHIDNRVPEAMKIPAMVLEVRKEPHCYIIVAKYELLGEVVQELLDKMIFRHHRRMIAQSRTE